MAERADAVYPVLWTSGPGGSATVGCSPARTGVGDLVAAVVAVLRRYGARPEVLRVRDVGAGAWSSVAVGDGRTMRDLRRNTVVPQLRGPAVEVALDDALTFALTPGGTVRVSTVHAPDDRRAPARIAAHVAAFLAAPEELPVAEVDHRAAEERELFRAVNSTERAVRAPLTLHGRVAEVAAATPDRVAVVQGGLSLTYRELDGLANSLALRIAAAGVGRGHRVGVSAARGVALVVGAYAAMKAGAAYVPLDPLAPRARQEILHRIGDVDLMLVEDGLELPTAPDMPVVALAPVSRMPSAPRGPAIAVDGREPAYVIFTSGSTGEPKGALLDHVGRVSMIRDLSTRVGLGPADRILAVSSPSFDMTVLDIFAALMAGAALVLPEKGRENDIEHWVELVERHGVTVWHSVPSALTLFLGAWGTRAGALRVFLLGGDWIPLSQPTAVRRAFPSAVFVSLGGATEVSVDSTYFLVDEVSPAWRSIPYGRPLGNQKAYVLDAGGQACGIDQPGELHLGGLGVGWGYHRRAALTAAKFVPDPFSDVTGARMYRTGDLARLRGDGELELIGRVDQQVKVGGVRIELGEVQACLREHPGVADAVVVAVRDAAGHAQALAAYLVPAGHRAGLAAAARQHLADRLPAAMVPARIEVVESVPTNANGKIARGELERRAGADPVDEELLSGVGEIWREVLGLAEAPTADTSFTELGGGSLAAIQVASRLNRRFVADVKVADLVEADTVARVAAVVASRRGRSARPALRRRPER